MSVPTLDSTNLSDEERLLLNSQIVENEFYTPDHYYLDLSLFKDFRYGAAVVLCMQRPRQECEQLLTRLQAGIPAYQLRSYETLTQYIPGLPFTEDDIDACLMNPEMSDQILMVSPVTTAIDTLSAHLIINANHSAVAENFKKIPVGDGKYVRKFDHITFHINTYPLQLSKAAKEFLGAFFVSQYAVNTELLCIPPRTLPSQLFELCDEFMTRSLWDIVESPSIQEGCKPLVHLNKSIIATPVFPMDKKQKFPENVLGKERRIMKSYLDMFFSLKWLEPRMYALDGTLFDQPDKGLPT